MAERFALALTRASTILAEMARSRSFGAAASSAKNESCGAVARMSRRPWFSLMGLPVSTAFGKAERSPLLC